MKLFKNKFFILGNLAFLLIAIPVVLYFVKNKTSTRSSASPTTTISFNPTKITTTQCDSTQQANLILTPNQNVVNIVKLALKWDPAKFDIEFAPNKAVFAQTPDGPPVISNGTLTVTLTNSDVTKAVTSASNIGTVTIKPLSPTNGLSSPLSIDPILTQVRSLSAQDGTSENVFNPVGSDPLAVTITSMTCQSTQPTSSPTPTTAALAQTATPTLTPTPTTVASNNQPPVCLSLSTSVSSGSAPLSITLTGSGQDSDGTVEKATFNFGDGTIQDVTTGMGTASVSAQLSHTYTVGGNYSSTVLFTDNSGATSSTCTQPIQVSGTSATSTPTPTTALVGGGIQPTNTPTITPTIKNPGSVGTTVGIIGGVVMAIAAGIFLLVL